MFTKSEQKNNEAKWRELCLSIAVSKLEKDTTKTLRLILKELGKKESQSWWGRDSQFFRGRDLFNSRSRERWLRDKCTTLIEVARRHVNVNSEHTHTTNVYVPLVTVCSRMILVRTYNSTYRKDTAIVTRLMDELPNDGFWLGPSIWINRKSIEKRRFTFYNPSWRCLYRNRIPA